MIHGFVISARYIHILPLQSMSFLWFCICSSTYHLLKYTNAPSYQNAFLLDILSQQIACAVISPCQITKKIATSLFLFSVFNVRYNSNKNTIYVLNGLLYLMSARQCMKTVFWFCLGFIAFIGSKRLSDSEYLHAVFHIFGNLGVACYFESVITIMQKTASHQIPLN